LKQDDVHIIRTRVCPMHFDRLQYSVHLYVSRDIISELFRLVEKN